MRGCIDTFEQNGNEADIWSRTNLEMMAERLPPALQSRWGRHQKRMLPEKSTLRTLDAFLEDYIEGEELGKPVHWTAIAIGTRDSKAHSKDTIPKGKPSHPPFVRAMADPKPPFELGLKTGPTTSAPKTAGELAPKPKSDPAWKPMAEAATKTPFCFACESKEHNTVASFWS